MAKVIPHLPDDYNHSPGEREAVLALRHLPDEYYVYYSLRWLSPHVDSTQGEADFIVFHPKKGFIVIEVKSGGITCKDGIWKQKNRQTGVERNILDPAVQADRSRFYLADKAADSLPASESCLHGYGVWLTSIDRKDFTYPPNYTRDILLDRHDLAAPLPAIERLFTFWASKHANRGAHRLTPAGKERLLALFAPEVDAAPSLRARVEERDEQMVRLTREQVRILDFLEEQPVAAICGRAGTGKTFVAWEKARRLASRGESVLFLCYNAPLKDFLRSRNADLSTLKVHSFHSLAAHLLGRGSDFRWLEEQFLEWATRGDNRLPFQHVLIDEAQDFAEEWLQALQSTRASDGVFYAFFDRHQLINREAFPAALERLECRLMLDTNCRNTKQIARTSLSFIELERAGMFKAADGSRPQLHVVADREGRWACAAHILHQKLVGGEYQPHEIALLCFGAESQPAAEFVNFPLADHLEEGSICCTTVRRFKGLEAKVVILLDASGSTFRSAQSRREFYVGASRAMHELHVIFEAQDEVEISKFIAEICERDQRKLRKDIRGLKQLLGAEIPPKNP